MKCITSVIGPAALSSTVVAAAYDYHHILQESFVGTSSLTYEISEGDTILCEGDDQSTEWGDSTFEHLCNDDRRISLDIDAGDHGQVTPTIPGGALAGPLDLVKDAPDKQFGCGNTVCVGIQEERSGSVDVQVEGR